MQMINVALVQGDLGEVIPIADDAAQLFYNRLFELGPSLKPMFAHSDMAEQRKKSMQMITVAVRGLSRLDELMPAVHAPGKRHVGYGVMDEHYVTVGAALLWTLEQGLGAAFNDEAHESWTATYFTLANAMKSAAAQGIAA